MRTAIKLLRPAARSVALGAVLAVMALSGEGAFAGPIQVTPEQIERLGIQTGVAEAAKEQTITSVLGRVTPALNARMLVTAPYAGTVVRVDGLEGQHVKAGEALASIASRTYLEARSEMAQQKGRIRRRQGRRRSHPPTGQGRHRRRSAGRGSRGEGASVGRRGQGQRAKPCRGSRA